MMSNNNSSFFAWCLKRQLHSEFFMWEFGFEIKISWFLKESVWSYVAFFPLGRKNFFGRNLTLVGRYFVKCAISGLRVRILLAEKLFSVERWFWGVCATGEGVLEIVFTLFNLMLWIIWIGKLCAFCACLASRVTKKLSKHSLLKSFFNYSLSKHYRWPACLGYIHTLGRYC